jgi:hypothetical protein
MLGEAALTAAADAERYFQSYCLAIHALAEQATSDKVTSNLPLMDQIVKQLGFV